MCFFEPFFTQGLLILLFKVFLVGVHDRYFKHLPPTRSFYTRVVLDAVSDTNKILPVNIETRSDENSNRKIREKLPPTLRAEEVVRIMHGIRLFL